jgi:Uma2 family endonuclease
MVMASKARRWTAVAVRDLIQEDRAWPRYEVVDGEMLVTPAPSWQHQATVVSLVIRLQPYVDAWSLGRVFTSPADIEFNDATLVQPDVFVVYPFDGRTAKSWKEVGKLMLAIEIVSPSSRKTDRFTKRLLFQRDRIHEYWIVDLDRREVERWRSDDPHPERSTQALPWHPPGAAQPLTIDLPAMFDEIVGRRPT